MKKEEKDLQVAAYNQAAKEHMIASISFALDFLETNTYVSSDEIDDAMEGLRDAIRLLGSLED